MNCMWAQDLRLSSLSSITEVLINKPYCGLLRKSGQVIWGSFWQEASLWATEHRDRPTSGSSAGPSWILLFQWSFETGYLKIVYKNVSTLVRFSLATLWLEQISRNGSMFQSTEWFLLSVKVLACLCPLISTAAQVRSSLHGLPWFLKGSISVLTKGSTCDMRIAQNALPVMFFYWSTHFQTLLLTWAGFC